MKKVHVVLLPWIEQGHLTPMLQLSCLLASQQGFLVSFAITAHARARFNQASSALPSHPNLHFHTLDDGLSDVLHSPSIVQIMASWPFTHQSLDQLVQALMASPSPVTCLIADTYCAWSQATARKFNIPRAELFVCPAYYYCCGVFHDRLLSAGLLPLKGERKDTWITCIPGLPPVRASDYIGGHLLSEEQVQADAEKVPALLHQTKQVFGDARNQFRLLVNSSHDLESQAFDALLKEHIPACAVGPLFLLKAPTDEADKLLKQPGTNFYEEDRMCLRWLDTKAPASTLYVAFGSECKLEKRDMQELAYGLEASGRNFLWVIRPGSVVGGGGTSMEEEGLPQGFRERVGERGMVVAWAPQMSILAHPAIGGFFSHCGWNSIMESLWLGVPILALPHNHEQGLTKHHVVEEWKVGIEVKKNEEGRVCRTAVETGVRSLLGGAECGHVRQAVEEMRRTVSKAAQAGGSSQRNFDQFVEDLRKLGISS